VRVEVVVTSWVMRAVRFLAAQFPKIHISSYMVCGQSRAHPLTNLLVSPCRIYLVHAYIHCGQLCTYEESTCKKY